MPMKAQAIAKEALDRALRSESITNYPTIYEGFMEKGIAETDIRPRENVFTYHAWRAKGRQVIRGEHGVRVSTYVSVPKKTDPATGEVKQKAHRFPRTTTVFHVSQTKLTKE